MSAAAMAYAPAAASGAGAAATEEVEMGPSPIGKLESVGISATVSAAAQPRSVARTSPIGVLFTMTFRAGRHLQDIKKFQDAGYHTVESVAYATLKVRGGRREFRNRAGWPLHFICAFGDPLAAAVADHSERHQ